MELERSTSCGAITILTPAIALSVPQHPSVNQLKDCLPAVLVTASQLFSKFLFNICVDQALL